MSRTNVFRGPSPISMLNPSWFGSLYNWGGGMEITLLSTVVSSIVVCREVRSVGLSVFNSPVFVTQKFIYINSYFCRLFFLFWSYSHFSSLFVINGDLIFPVLMPLYFYWKFKGKVLKKYILFMNYFLPFPPTKMSPPLAQPPCTVNYINFI